MLIARTRKQLNVATISMRNAKTESLLNVQHLSNSVTHCPLKLASLWHILFRTRARKDQQQPKFQERYWHGPYLFLKKTSSYMKTWWPGTRGQGWIFFNRFGVAGAVLQTPLSFITFTPILYLSYWSWNKMVDGLLSIRPTPSRFIACPRIGLYNLLLQSMLN